LKYSVTEDHLKEYFEKFGTLTDYVVIKNPITKLSQGYGFITFEETNMMETCLESQPHYLNGKIVGLRNVTPRDSFQKEASLWVGRLDRSVTKEDLKQYFEKFGELTDWAVTLGPSRSFGFVTFQSIQEMEKCLMSKHHHLNGNPIIVRRFGSQKSHAEKTDLASKCFTAERLPIKGEELGVWEHCQAGEKHRIRFCASENIVMVGISLLVRSSVSRVTLNLCQDREEDYHCQRVIFKQDFEKVTGSSDGSVVLELRTGVKLSCDRIYLLVLTMYGGSSYVGSGGEEFVATRCPGQGREVLFKFEDYRHRTDRRYQATDVEHGLLEKIYFKL